MDNCNVFDLEQRNMHCVVGSRKFCRLPRNIKVVGAIDEIKTIEYN